MNHLAELEKYSAEVNEIKDKPVAAFSTVGDIYLRCKKYITNNNVIDNEIFNDYIILIKTLILKYNVIGTDEYGTSCEIYRKYLAPQEWDDYWQYDGINMICDKILNGWYTSKSIADLVIELNVLPKFLNNDDCKEFLLQRLKPMEDELIKYYGPRL